MDGGAAREILERLEKIEKKLGHIEKCGLVRDPVGRILLGVFLGSLLAAAALAMPRWAAN